MGLSNNFWLKGLIGPMGANTDGSEVAARFDRRNALIVNQLSARYSEATQRGSMYALSLPATTTGAAAGNLKGAAAAAVTNFALWNPLTSGVNLVLTKLLVGVISGTPPGGPLFHSYATILPTIATLLTDGTMGPTNLKGSASLARAIAVAAGSALTGGGALTVLRPASLDFSATAFSDAQGMMAQELIDGDIVIPPGFMYVPTWASAGTALLNAYGLTWEEVPV